MIKTLIKTFDGDIYIIEGKTPRQVHDASLKLDFIEMPNGSVIHRKSISAFQTYEDYAFQTDQKLRHKKGQYIKGGNWNDGSGVIDNAFLSRITGDIVKKLKQ